MQNTDPLREPITILLFIVTKGLHSGTDKKSLKFI